MAEQAFLGVFADRWAAHADAKHADHHVYRVPVNADLATRREIAAWVKTLDGINILPTPAVIYTDSLAAATFAKLRWGRLEQRRL